MLELEEELDRQLTREQRMKRQVDKLRQEEELRPHAHGHTTSGVYAGGSVYPASAPLPFASAAFEDQRMYEQAVSLANMRSAMSVQQAEIEDLQ